VGRRLAPCGFLRANKRWLLVAAGLVALVPLTGGQSGLGPGTSLPFSFMGVSNQPSDPVQFSAEELQTLERRFGVHGPQPRLAQLLSDAVIDQIQPLRSHTFGRLENLRPLIRRESERQRVNPMLVAAVLLDEMRHAKPGEDLPLAAHSGLFQTHGLGQLGLGEMQKQGLLSEDPSADEITAARDHLLDPDRNVRLLIGKFARLSRELELPSGRELQASGSATDAKALATLAYLHNGKLDYPRRILRHMQDPELHALVYGSQRKPVSPLI
jgi:hypothetical protein